MAYGNYGQIEGGQGGKLGHSNMTHWDGTEIIKDNTKKKRRNQSKKIIKEALEEMEVEKDEIHNV